MSIEKYLGKYSEPETGFASLISSTYQNVLCIPAYAESPDFIDRLKQMPASQPVLVVLVINSPDEDTDPVLQQQTTVLMNYCQSLPVIRCAKGAALYTLASEPQTEILLIDRCTESRRIPCKQGVGLARKIAADIALSLINDKLINSQWIYFSDADVSLPKGYFDAGNEIDPESASTLIYPFRHTTHPDPAVNKAQNLYDFTLYYYEEGLKYADSPYAWQSLGSTLAVSARHYAEVRGVPKRNAGEDFHLINKLSKTGRVVQLNSPALEIETRLSSRVPYGTGPALTRLVKNDNQDMDIRAYSPDTFKMLKLALSGLYASYPFVKHHAFSDLSILFRDNCTQDETEHITAVLNILGTAEALVSAMKNSTGENSFQKHVTHWFDALKTLRFIHLMRDNYYPSQPLRQLVNEPLYQSTINRMQGRGVDFTTV